MQAVEAFLGQLQGWLTLHADIQGLLLVGSHARGGARADSDVDLVLLCDAWDGYLSDDAWSHAFGLPIAISTEDWGGLISRRVFYAHGLEVEFGFAPCAWAATSPVDSGTRAVVQAGARILHDPQHLLQQLLTACGE